MTDFPEIIELDINPLMVKNGNIIAVDARVLISAPLIPSPMHLIISSYPWQYEKKETTINGQGFFIRPIRPSDSDLLIDHFYSLSSRSVYMRFFSPVKHLSKTMLIKFTQIDYDREVALVALKGKGVKQVMGIVLAENTQMLMLGRKLGFSVKRHPDSGEYDLIIDFKDMKEAGKIKK